MPVNGSSFLITGGTSSFGQRLIRTLFDRYDIKRLVVHSRDELKQCMKVQNDYPAPNDTRLRFFIGHARDRDRLSRAREGIGTVVYAAALKQVPAGEYNPQEFVKTNIGGPHNVIDAALDSRVKRVAALSTDKASAPINVIGATKLLSDSLFLSADNIKVPRDLRFSVARRRRRDVHPNPRNLNFKRCLTSVAQELLCATPAPLTLSEATLDSHSRAACYEYRRSL